MKTNQYGFKPQKGTIDAAMEVKNYILEGLGFGEFIVLASLDVKGAFDAAKCPSILNALRACGCSKTYTTQQKASLASVQ